MGLPEDRPIRNGSGQMQHKSAVVLGSKAMLNKYPQVISGQALRIVGLSESPSERFAVALVGWVSSRPRADTAVAVLPPPRTHFAPVVTVSEWVLPAKN